MPIRTKILLIILLLSVPPLIFLRLSGMQSMDELVLRVQTRTVNLLLDSQSRSLQRIVEDHVVLLRRERQLVESALEALVAGTANALDTADFSAALSILSKKQPPPMHGSMRRMMRKADDFYIFSPSLQIEESLAAVSPLMREFSDEYPELILWQEIQLVDNSQLFYSTDKEDVSALQHNSHSMMSTSGKTSIWSMPMQDMMFNTSIFTASQVIKLKNGMIAGTATIAVPVKNLLRDPGNLSAISSNITSYVIQANTQDNKLLILAKRKLKEREGRWFIVPDDVLDVSKEARMRISQDILDGKSGAWVIEIKGIQYLATFAPFEKGNSALLITIPREDIMKVASKEKDIIRYIFSNQLDISLMLLGVTIFLVCVAAAYFSHSLSKNIHKLVQCVREIGKGNFSTRIPDVGKDEIGELGAALNEMVPALEENVHLKSSLQLASDVQKNLLPKDTPQLDLYDIAGASYYCAETGGDYFDFISCVPEKSGSRTLHMAVGDVVGHGVSAALLMATARAYLRSSATTGCSLSKITHDANELLVYDTFGTGQFVTLFLASLDTATGTFKWTRAGHDAAIMYRNSTESFEYIKGAGATALGVVSNASYAENATSLEDGDLLLIATDGIWECMSPEGEMFGKQRIENIMYENKNLSSAKLIEKLYSEVLEYSQQPSLEDDFTCILIKKKITP